MSARQPFLRIFWHRCPGAPIRPGSHTSSFSSWRSFASSAPRCARPSKRVKRALASTASTSEASNFKPGHVGKLALKVAREGDVVLFQGPSQKAYMISAYGVGALCFAYSIWQSRNLGDPAMPLQMWQQGLYAGICVIMTGFGVVVLSRTSNMVRAITAIQSGGRVYIRFTVRRPVPFTKPYTFEVLPSQVNISRRLVVSPESRERFENDSLKIGSANDSKSNWFNPVQWLSLGFWRLFMSMRQVFTGEDFILLQIEGRKGTFRMDSNGYVANEFVALGDPLVWSRKRS